MNTSCCRPGSIKVELNQGRLNLAPDKLAIRNARPAADDLRGVSRNAVCLESLSPRLRTRSPQPTLSPRPSGRRCANARSSLIRRLRPELDRRHLVPHTWRIHHRDLPQSLVRACAAA